MSLPWDVEVSLSAEAACRLVRSQFPSITGSECRIIGQGWDNRAVLVDGEFVFRFPHRASAVPLIELEARVLPGLQARLPIRIPNPVFVGRPAETFPWPFLGYRLIHGRLACGARLSHQARAAAARVLGGFLARLHALPLDGLMLPGDALERTNMARRLGQIEERLDALRRRGVIRSATPWLELFSQAERSATARPAAIVHADLYARHFIVDEADAVVGVIDWGDIHAGDIAVDLMLAYEFLPAEARAAFMSEYGRVDEDVLTRARLRAAFHAISLTWYAHETADADLIVEGMQALQFVLES